MIKIIRASTVPISLNVFCRGLLRELSNRYEVIALSSPGNELEEISTREGVRTIAVPMQRHISIFSDCKSLCKMVWLFRKEKPTMVHSMTPKAGMICMLAAWLTRVPVRVHTFTGLVFPTSTGLKRRILMFTDWLTCACATQVIPEGRGVKNDLIQNGITKKTLKILGCGNVRGIDMKYYTRRPEVLSIASTIQNERLFTFLFVGRIVRNKGIDELAEAFEMLCAKCANVRLILVGPIEDSIDPISSNSRTIMHENPAIEVVGSQSGDELLAYYAAADCFILPSYREGFPNTVLEAGAMGLPCIVTDINGSREIIKDGINGMIVKPKDVGALFRAMDSIVQSPEDRNNMASHARQMIADRFEQGFVRKCLYDYYDEILAPYK